MVRKVPAPRQAAGTMVLAALVAACLASACALLAPAPYNIELASPDERLPKPRFTIIQRSRPNDPSYYRVDLYDRDTGMRTWRALSNSLGPRSTTLVYGELEGQWTVEVGPTPLQEGKHYKLEIVGEGDGNIRFRVEPDGRLVEEES